MNVSVDLHRQPLERLLARRFGDGLIVSTEIKEYRRPKRRYTPGIRQQRRVSDEKRENFPGTSPGNELRG